MQAAKAAKAAADTVLRAKAAAEAKATEVVTTHTRCTTHNRLDPFFRGPSPIGRHGSAPSPARLGAGPRVEWRGRRRPAPLPVHPPPPAHAAQAVVGISVAPQATGASDKYWSYTGCQAENPRAAGSRRQGWMKKAERAGIEDRMCPR
jgi:hypothetical protein